MVSKPVYVDPKNVRKVKKRGVVDRRDRVTIVGFIHHEQMGESPNSTPFRHTTLLKTKHEPFGRRITVGIKPVSLTLESEGCWIPPQDFGKVYIENKTGAGALMVPSKEQKEDLQKQILLIRGKDGSKGWQVPPGDIHFSYVESPGDIVLASATGKNLNIYVKIYPR